MSVTTVVTLQRAMRDAAATLREAGMTTSDLDARVLAAYATGRSAAQLIADGNMPLEPSAELKLAASIARRAAGEPVARIVGHREFWGLDFTLNEATLEPRPDTETVVEATLEAVDAGQGRGAALRLVDLGTGSGCLLVALLVELPAAFGIGIDIDETALRAARHNATTNGVGSRASFMVGNWTAALAGGVDVIVANPPYIRSCLISTLAAEVAWYDPRAALDGGEDGLDAYRALLPGAAAALAEHGMLILEHGIEQQQPLMELIGRAGLAVRGARHDLAGLDRVLIATHVGFSQSWTMA